MGIEAELHRWNPDAECTLGVMRVQDFRCHTIEKPWVDDGTPGGKSFASCVPDGTYELRPFRRPDKDDGRPGDEVYALVNESLGVYLYEDDVPGDTRAEKERNGRWLILLHPANWVHQVVGCVGPGLTQTKHATFGQMVGSSRVASSEIFRRLDTDVNNTLVIRTL